LIAENPIIACFPFPVGLSPSGTLPPLSEIVSVDGLSVLAATLWSVCAALVSAGYELDDLLPIPALLRSLDGSFLMTALPLLFPIGALFFGISLPYVYTP